MFLQKYINPKLKNKELKTQLYFPIYLWQYRECLDGDIGEINGIYLLCKKRISGAEPGKIER